MCDWLACAQAQNGATALHNAAGGGHTGAVRALLAARADADVQNGNCNTALHLAAGKGAGHPAPVLDNLLLLSGA
jgi:ankyrin repeat protein